MGKQAALRTRWGERTVLNLVELFLSSHARLHLEMAVTDECTQPFLCLLSRSPCSFHIDFGTVKFKALTFLATFLPVPANEGSSLCSMTWAPR